MTDLVIASANKHKITEIQAILSGYRLIPLSELGDFPDVEETGSTFFENSLLKAKAACDATGLPAIADDSGLEVECLNGAPGVYSARFSGVHGDDEANIRKLLSEMNNAVNRKARFACAMTVCYPDGSYVSADGFTEGEILLAKDGNKGFGYDPVFFSYDLQKSFGVADDAEKNSVSHRARAIANLKKLL